MLEPLPRKKFAFLPTPVHRMDNLADALNIENLWIKRDDLTGISAGGNKTRKLEYVVGDAIEKGADTLATVGAIQSNHCRQTAAVAAKTGMRCILLFAGEEPEIYTGNLLYCRLMGAEMKFFPDDAPMMLNNRLDEIMNTLIEFGLTPYAIPAGAAFPVGVVPYAVAMQELKTQFDEHNIFPDKILVAIGTGGTLAGMIIALIASTSIADTVVRFETALGTFDVQLFDSTTPITAGNFLNYVRNADYDDSFFHRLASGFVLQGGG